VLAAPGIRKNARPLQNRKKSFGLGRGTPIGYEKARGRKREIVFKAGEAEPPAAAPGGKERGRTGKEPSLTSR